MNDGETLTIGVSVVTAPYIDDDSAQVIADAIDTLRLLRSAEMYNSADDLSLLVSLATQARALIPDAIDAAVEQGFTWTQIAHSAGISPAAARRRHAARTNRKPPIEPD
jgi:hypothetical protein